MEGVVDVVGVVGGGWRVWWMEGVVDVVDVVGGG